MARISHIAWRRVIAGVLAYALALQGFIFALDIGRPAMAADDANGTIWAGFELCSHSGAGSPGAPSQNPAGDPHCLFCIAGAVYVNCAPPCAPQSGKVVLAGAVWPLAAPRLVAFFINEGARPRGPPAAA